jgi:chloramphenicol 3-O-phosphotransferase
VAQLLAERLPRAAHVRGDAFRRMIVSGRAEMVPSAGDEAIAQLQLRYRLGSQTADAYAAAGFTAIYQDIILGDDLASAPDRITARPMFVVVLAPQPDAIDRRAESRSKAGGYGDWSVAELDQRLRESPRIGLWLDTSDQTPHETADEIVRRGSEARIR